MKKKTIPVKALDEWASEYKLVYTGHDGERLATAAEFQKEFKKGKFKLIF